jgi:hypothetical protein
MTKRVTIKTIYEKYPYEYINYKMYKEIITTFHTLLSTEVRNTYEGIKLPNQMGVLRINKRRTNPDNKVIDFKKSKEYGEKIYHTNLHSEGYYGFYNWDKAFPHCVMRLKSIYKFVPTRHNKRALSAKIKSSNVISHYLE